MTSLYLWLLDATEGLSAESAAQVRAEIQQHYDSACEAGDDAIAALGDPLVANRAYRKVLLTEMEARMAPSLTQPKRTSLPAMLLTNALYIALFTWMGIHSKHHDPGFWPIQIAIFCASPLGWFFPRTTIEQIRIYVRAQGVRSVLIVAIAWWYQGWTGALVYGAISLIFFLLDYLWSYRIVLIFRKLGLRT